MERECARGRTDTRVSGGCDGDVLTKGQPRDGRRVCIDDLNERSASSAMGMNRRLKETRGGLGCTVHWAI